jgi:type IV pilus assembly protein PilY1
MFGLQFKFITLCVISALIIQNNATGQGIVENQSYEKSIVTSSVKSNYDLFPGNIKCNATNYAGNTSKIAISGDTGNPQFAILSDFDQLKQSGILNKIRLLDNFISNDFGPKFNTSRNVPATPPFIGSNNLTSGAIFGDRSIAFPWMTTALDASTPVPKYVEHTTNLVSFVRGTQSPITAAGSTITDNFFARDSGNKLGMLVNSVPWIQRPPSSKITAPTYADFKTQYKDRREIVWVGSNDGMLHGFYANNGDFIMSFLPSPLFSRLYASAQPGRTPEALVDGSPFTADVGFHSADPKISEINSFKTYLFSSLGRGGKAIFALDVTDPLLLNATKSNEIFRWIFTDVDDGDLGYTIGNNSIHPVSNQPVSSIYTQNNRGFGLLVPNGVDSTLNKSVLYILFSEGPELFIDGLENSNPSRTPTLASRQNKNAWIKATTLLDPARYVKLVAPTTDATRNGLVGVTWFAPSNSTKAAYVYATDLNGKLWKFDINNDDFTFWQGFESNSTGKLSPPSKPTLVFDANQGKLATDPQISITTAPIIKLEANDRVRIIFGTGNALTASNFQDTNSQNRIYSILDNPKDTTQITRNDLSARLLKSVESATYIYSSSEATASKGWVIYFSVDSGEKVINNPVLLGDAVFVNTSAPMTSTTSGCGTQARVYAIDSKSGKAASSALGSVIVASNGVTTQVNALGIKSNDQNSVVVTKSDGTTTSVKIIGKTDNILALKYSDTNRSQWRTIPGMKSTQ